MQKNKYIENKTLKNQLQFFCNDSMQHVPQVTLFGSDVKLTVYISFP